MLAQGDVEGVVAGAVYPTADIIRCGLALIGRAPGVTSVSGAFYMVVPRGNGEESVFTFADCAAIAEPTSDQLASIALLSARDRRTIVGDEPVVALLSYSTYGSAEGLSVARIRHALELIRAADPDLIVDGELQVDAAIDGAVSARKAPGSVVSGRANVLIFPSLDAGNIAYKLVQRLARAGAIGPILQGLAKPLNDLSRGSDENDIINVTAVTALQGASRPSLA
jgi:phosphate acetyltransferase